MLSPRLVGECFVDDSFSAQVLKRHISLLTRDSMGVENYVCSVHEGFSMRAFLEVN